MNQPRQIQAQIVELLAANAQASATLHGREYDRAVERIADIFQLNQAQTTEQSKQLALAVVEGLRGLELSTNIEAPPAANVDVKVTPRIRLQVPREFDFTALFGIFAEILEQLKKLEKGMAIFDRVGKEICGAMCKTKRKTAIVQYEGEKIKKVTQVEE